MTPMEFTLGQLQIASVRTAQNADRSLLTAEKIKEKVLEIIKQRPSTSENVAAEMGFSKSTAKTYLRALVLDGEIKITASARVSLPATYRVAP